MNNKVDNNIGNSISNNSAKKKSSRIAGIDFGLARIGIALSDESHIIAFPLTTLVCEKKLEQTVKKFYNFFNDHEKAQGYILNTIVIGLPLMMSGKTSFLADEVKLFATELQKLTTTPIILFDERLTTVQAERALKERGHLNRKQRAQFVDSVSAVIILQTYLNKIEQQNERKRAEDIV